MVSEQVNSATELTGSVQVNITKELTRAPSFLDRVKSFNPTSPFKSNSPPDDTFTSQYEHFDVPPDRDVVEDHNDTSDNSRYNNLSNGTKLDYGILQIGSYANVLELLNYVSNRKAIDVYIGHDTTTLSTYFNRPKSEVIIEELDDNTPLTGASRQYEERVRIGDVEPS
nr:transposase, mutator type [Tanacetum cinerariifolium]